jgi:hypothetical protein
MYKRMNGTIKGKFGQINDKLRIHNTTSKVTFRHESEMWAV